MSSSTLFQSWLTAEEAITKTRNVFCVGRNYINHAKELGNAVPSSPMIFGKSTHALAPAQGEIWLPAGKDNIHHELEIVLFIRRTYEKGATVADMVSGVGLGLDLTDRTAQDQLKAAGHPWELAKGFPNSAVLTDVYRVSDIERMTEVEFSLSIDGKVIQRGVAQDMLFDFQTLIDFVGQNFGLSEGDILYTGTPEGVGPLAAGQQLVLQFGNITFGSCSIAQ
jgi:fumarylpyruvate hydrolase